MFLSPCDTQGAWELLRPAPWGALWYLHSSELPTPGHTLSRASTWGRSRLPPTSTHPIHGNQTIPQALNCPMSMPSAHSGGEPRMCQMLRVPPEAAVPTGRESGPKARPLWVQLWDGQQRVRLAPGPHPGVKSGSGSLGEGCSPTEDSGG